MQFTTNKILVIFRQCAKFLVAFLECMFVFYYVFPFWPCCCFMLLLLVLLALLAGSALLWGFMLALASVLFSNHEDMHQEDRRAWLYLLFHLLVYIWITKSWFRRQASEQKPFADEVSKIETACWIVSWMVAGPWGGAESSCCTGAASKSDAALLGIYGLDFWQKGALKKILPRCIRQARGPLWQRPH